MEDEIPALIPDIAIFDFLDASLIFFLRFMEIKNKKGTEAKIIKVRFRLMVAK